jgi:hypothetical protein
MVADGAPKRQSSRMPLFSTLDLVALAVLGD